MAVIYVRPASKTRFTTQGDQGERIITASFNIKCSTPNEPEANILYCGLLPVYGWSPFPQDLFAVCTRIDLQQREESSQYWTADCEWRTVMGKDPRNQQKPPDERRPVWSYSFQPISKYFPSDLDGNAFQDAAGTPFDPPPERPIWVDEIIVERYETKLTRKSDRKYLNACNSDSWLDAKPGEAFIHNIATTEVFEFAQYWFKRTFTILVSPRIVVAGSIGGPKGATGNPFVGAWDFECILNQGPKFIAAPPRLDAGQAIPIVEGGFIDGRPQRLDAKGAILAAGTANVYLKFRLKNSVKFAPLNLVPPY